MPNKHIVQLDGLRFFAVLSVMVAHWLQWQWGHQLVKLIPFTHGVILFFVLSGFLISRILFVNRDHYLTSKRDKIQILKRFYIRRFFRIFPIYYLLIIGLFIVNYQNTREIFPWLISYTSNIYQSIYNTDIRNFNHFWSLAVEEQFYFFWPILMLFIKPSKTLRVILIVISLSLMTKLYLFSIDYNWMGISYFTTSNLHALGLGALFAYIVQYKKKFAKSLSNPIWVYVSFLIYVSLFIIQVKFNIKWYKEIFDTFTFSCVAGLFILRASTTGFKLGIKHLLENKFIIYSGKISYGLYIFHLFIPELVYYIVPQTEYFNSIHPLSKYLLFIVYYLLTFVFAHISWRLIERPINKLKHKYPYR